MFFFFPSFHLCPVFDRTVQEENVLCHNSSGCLEDFSSWLVPCGRMIPPAVLPAGRSAFGKYTRALNWTWPLCCDVPQRWRLETQTDGRSVKRDVMSRKTTDDGGERSEKEKGMGGMRLLRSVFPANVLTFFWSAS